MCGIELFLGNYNREKVRELFMKISKRGPDNTEIVEYTDLFMGFHRLKVNDLTENGNQPFMFSDNNSDYYLLINGEIYNHLELEKEYNLSDKLKSKSDCEVILHLFIIHRDIKKVVNLLDGEFAGVIVERTDDKTKLYIFRDSYGVRPLYYGSGEGLFGISSELKGLSGVLDKIEQFPPGHVMEREGLEYSLSNYNSLDIKIEVYEETEALIGIREGLIKAVKKRMMSERPICCLLSGGLDSSLVASILSSNSKERIHTFCIGMEGGEDFYYARLVSKYINSIHHEIVLSESEFLEAIPEVVRTIESYDGTTCRASVGQYLVSKYISEKTDFKVVYVGEGSDELTGGYLYFHNAPDENEFDKECKRLLSDIHYFDGKRSDRCISGFGLESRVSFLDRDFVRYYLSIDKKLRYRKGEIEKLLLRKAFIGYLPDEVLWRVKEAFSDGVSSKRKSWYEIINEMVRERVGEEYEEGRKRYGRYLMPYNEELYYYRKIFSENYENENVLPYYWLPRWSGNVIEASARVLDVYKK